MGKWTWLLAYPIVVALAPPCVAAEAKKDDFRRMFLAGLCTQRDDIRSYKIVCGIFREAIKKYPNHPLRVEAEYHLLVAKAGTFRDIERRDAELVKDWDSFEDRLGDTKYPFYYQLGVRWES